MSDLNINLDATVEFLVGLLKTPSPTGYYLEAMDYTRKAFEKIPGLTISTTNKGALVATMQGASHDAPRGMTAHVDTLGLMVKDVKPSGRLKLALLGGFMW
ncbi:MAG TPA: hypothetical protein VHD90_08215, partial [Phototrophicaceae bacterium]|nr:hypothetical protein [Phototrophicaceae bacterium]